MSIPKTIHYCWFGHNPKPKLALKCIQSWKKYCPDYQVIEWNEDNFDISSCPLYVRQAYEVKKWAFVTDYVRLKVVREHGGIYLDTDVELIKPLDALLEYSAYFGFEDGRHIATGLGFGAEKGHPILKEIMDDYENIPFILENGEYDRLSCPKRNTSVFIRHGLIQNNQTQRLDDNTQILSAEWLCPKSFESGLTTITKNTYSIHHFDASWFSEEAKHQKEKQWKKEKREFYIDYIIHTPNRVVKCILGSKRYELLKQALKKGR